MQQKQTSAAALLERLPIILLWLASTAFVMAGLPAVPAEIPDSLSYIEIAPNRPPVFGWMIHALKAAGLVGPDFAGLPLIQIISAGLLAFTLWLARLLAAPWASLATVLVWAHLGTYEATRWLTSEALFLSLMLFGLAASIAYACRNRLLHLLVATVFFGLSALTRTAGLALLLIPLLLVALDGRLRLGAVAKRSAAVTGVAAMLMLGGMWANMLRHGHFEIGSNSGVSLLGKGMLLLQPGPHGNPVLDDMAPRAGQARAAVDAAPDTAASLRAQAQAYEELRWRGFFEKAGTVWPGVTMEPRRETNMVSGQVARAIIAEQPLAYLRLVARDWLALVIYPHLWPVAGTENARLAPFDDCDIRPLECWAHPWTAPFAQELSRRLRRSGVVCSHPFGLASRRQGRRP